MREAPAQESRSSFGSSVSENSANEQVIRNAIDHARHYLPSQGPISVFVHHNTLHAFEELSFDEAVIQGGRLYNCQPYLSENRYREEFRRGRISIADLRQVLMDDLGDKAEHPVASCGSRYTLRLAMLQSGLQSAPDAELQWMLAETYLLKRLRPDLPATQREQQIQQTKVWVTRNYLAIPSNIESDCSSIPASLIKTLISQIGGRRRIDDWPDADWETMAVRLLWELCRNGVSKSKLPKPQILNTLHYSELIRDVWGLDIDGEIDDLLIRFCSCFLDQGLANWRLPNHEKGFAYAFAKLHLQPLSIKPNWLEGISELLQPIIASDFDPLESISYSLNALRVNKGHIEPTITRCLLRLRGWAGMIDQMESNTPWLPYPASPGTLNQYLAVRLILLRQYLKHVAQSKVGSSDLQQLENATLKRQCQDKQPSIDQRTFQLFELAQVCCWTPELVYSLEPAELRQLQEEIDAFPAHDRRRIWHHGYERHYRNAALNALAVHTERRRQSDNQSNTKPAYVAIFCIDDREESFRRHLEEADPECVTASAAGFFAVAMYYRGADHAHFRPLCPNIITPRHYVREEAAFSVVDAARRRADRRKRLGHLTHQVHAGSRTVAVGWLTGLLGAAATIPMVARILTPRIAARVRESFGTWINPPATELVIERSQSEPGPEPEAMGYSLEEMATIVTRILEDTGLVKELAPVVLLFGHGSSSLNNPHESAYNCGACSGGRGGPNARAFAMMANDPRVREIMANRGIIVPNDVRFLGAYHNTCNDRVEYYDLDLLPRTHRKLFRRIEQKVDRARAHNAHERSRRFESAPLDLTPQDALEHVEERSEDLSQARPEYNHATNALVFVGRRQWSRGLFLDRRCFVTSYDPTVDDEQASILNRILQAAIPVCAGISLEYYFSTVDSEGYGCGSKLPHNIASLVGVMTGASSDLRPGLSQQMVEIHEPMRILFVIETTAAKLLPIIEQNLGIRRLVEGRWIQLAIIAPNTSEIEVYGDGRFEPYVPDAAELPIVDSSAAWYRGQRDHLGFATIAEVPSEQCDKQSAPVPQAAGGS